MFFYPHDIRKFSKSLKHVSVCFFLFINPHEVRKFSKSLKQSPLLHIIRKFKKYNGRIEEEIIKKEQQ